MMLLPVKLESAFMHQLQPNRFQARIEKKNFQPCFIGSVINEHQHCMESQNGGLTSSNTHFQKWERSAFRWRFKDSNIIKFHYFNN